MFSLFQNSGQNSITVEELSKMDHDSGKFFFVDVRESSEWEEGHIEWFTHIPLRQVPNRINEFLGYEKVLFICRSGARSAQACNTLRTVGIDTAYNVQGGMVAWSRDAL